MYNRYERCVAAGDCLASVAGGAHLYLIGTDRETTIYTLSNYCHQFGFQLLRIKKQRFQLPV